MKKKQLITRRTALVTGITALGGYLLYRTVKSPAIPTYGSILRAGDNFTYAAQRALLSKRALAEEYSRSDLTTFPAVGTIDPGDENNPAFSRDYAVMRQHDFSDWKLSVEGRVARPGQYSLASLQ